MNHQNLNSPCPNWKQVVQDLIDATEDFDDDDMPIDGADFVEWFGHKRREIKAALQRDESVQRDERWHNA